MKTADAEEEVDHSRKNEVFEAQQRKSLELRSEKIKERLSRLKKLQIWIEKNREAIRHAVNADFQKPKPEVDISEVYPVIAEIKHAQQHLRQWAKPKKVDTPLAYLGSTSYIQYEPRGVCLILSPWNYPFSLAIGPLISALAAGCTAVLKPSEMTPHTSALIDTMIGETFQEDEVAVFQGGVETSQALLELPFDHIFFTGSPAVGKIVMAEAAKSLTSVTLELGGKSPAIIDKSANLKDAAEKVAWGKFLNCGQTCVAPDYVLIEHTLKEKFVELLKSAIQLQFDKTLEGFEKSADYTRIVNDKHYKRINKLIEDALEKGATLEMGGSSHADEKFIPPTILSNVPGDSEVMEEEIFGPVLPIVTFESLEESIQAVNSKPKPLALYYFGTSRKNRKAILSQTSSGGVCVNDCVLQFGHTNLPFGGVNNSGIGKSHGHHGFLAFSNEKPVLKQRVGFTSNKTVYPPYTKTVEKLINAIVKYF